MHVFFLLSDGAGNASIQGGVFENDYVREDGEWKISLHHFFPQYAGPYETGWTNWQGEDLGILPYHFTPDESGIPIPDPVGTAPQTTATLAWRRHSGHWPASSASTSATKPASSPG